MQRVCSRQHQISNTQLTVHPLEREMTDVKSCAIQVTGIIPGSSKEVISLFFESEKRAGGGMIEDFFMDIDNNASFITFESSEGKLIVLLMMNHVYS